jgi:UDP-N-acetylmuramoyl-L-alanyl-D-glutamate--2,6-diaminopimelate ligase
MLAIVGALYLGVDPILIQESLHKMPGVDGRLEIIEDAVTVIVDYAHTPRALENVLKTINTAKNSGQNLITVFGCGGERDRAKRPNMARIAEIYSDRVIVTTDNSRGESELDIIRDILEGFSNTEKRIVIASREAAIEHAILSAREKDLIAIIGKGHEQYNIDKNGYHPFNEKDIILRALKKRKGIRKNDNNTGNFTDA